MRGLLTRICAEWRAKLFWALVLNVYFYVGYPLLQRHHLGEPHLISPTFVDDLIPFLPGSTWVYLSLGLFLPIAPMLMTRRESLRHYGLCSLAVTTIAFAVFYFFPTTWTRPPLPDGHALYRSVASADLPLNELPSLHAAYSVFTLVVLVRMFRGMRAPFVLTAGATLWALAILFTTLATKQHAFVDLLAGAALGGVGGWQCMRRVPSGGISNPWK